MSFEPNRKPPICPYCNNPSELVSGVRIYPHRPDLFTLVFYQCAPCDAHVGCHKNTYQPLGRLANKELRYWKQRAHGKFDPLWKSKRFSRSEAYMFLAEKLGIRPSACHIGEFDVETCKKVAELFSGPLYTTE